MEKSSDVPVMLFEKQKDWTDWLEEQNGQSTGVWLKLAKKGSRVQSITYDEALESALCLRKGSTSAHPAT